MVYVQALATQAAVAFATVALQSFEHAPQFCGLVDVCVSQPVFPVAQWAWPGLHAQLHAPSAHDGAPFAVLHASPHALQLRTSVAVSTQKPPQQVPPFGHVPARVQPSTQLPAGLHFLPPVQSVSPRHWTHWWRATLQSGALGLSCSHSVEALHPGAHSFDGRQWRPVGQSSAAAVHSTHFRSMHFVYGGRQSFSVPHGQSIPTHVSPPSSVTAAPSSVASIMAVPPSGATRFGSSTPMIVAHAAPVAASASIPDTRRTRPVGLTLGRIPHASDARADASEAPGS